MLPIIELKCFLTFKFYVMVKQVITIREAPPSLFSDSRCDLTAAQRCFFIFLCCITDHKAMMIKLNQYKRIVQRVR